MTVSLWTEELLDLAKRLWDQGFSAAEISRRLPVTFTRNAVLGRLHRLGLTQRDGQPPRAKRELSRPAIRSTKHMAIVAAAIPIVAPDPALTADGSPITLLIVENGQCRWPLWGMQEHNVFPVCGLGTKGEAVYCEFHVGVAFGKGTASERSAVRSAKQVDAKEAATLETEAA